MPASVTIGVKCFNQEASIGAAVKGALSQTYRPLEVVVSDDGSKDGSWTAIRSVLEESGFAEDDGVWRKKGDDGVRVILNRNAVNRGNLGNWMSVCALAHGEWLVKADGDDVSEPNRVERIMAALERNDGDPVTVVMHGARREDASGRPMREQHPRHVLAPLGALMAFSRVCYDAFPKTVLNERLMDDEVFVRRALMFGQELLVDEPLVRYRVGTGVSSDEDDVKGPELRCSKLIPETNRQARLDLESVREHVSEERADKLLAWFDWNDRQMNAAVTLMSGATFADRLRGWRAYEKPSPFRPGFWKYAAYLLPPRIGDVLLRFLARLRG